MDIRTEVVLWTCGSSWIGICLVGKDKVQGGAVRVDHIRNASFVSHRFSCVHSLSPAVGESLLRQICKVFVTVPDHRRSAIHQRFAMPWPWFGLSCSCGRTGQGGMERCGVMWCVVVVGWSKVR